VGVVRGHDVGVPPAIVLLHGFTQTGASWRPVLTELGERSRALAPDLRGHGAAADARPVDFPECAADVAAAAPDRFLLAGYSMGARVALHVALAHPQRVTNLVLVGATPGIADEVERAERREEDERLAAELEAEDDIEKFARRWAKQPLLRRQPAGVAAAAHEDRLRNQPRGLAAALRGIGAGATEPLWGRLGELAMPVVLIAGERDSKYRKLAERMAAEIPRADVLVVPAVGHAVHLEAPAIAAAAIEQRANRAA
jgi:2-succinyl-6-hydroxy-2,4-cyclohexadiene-1-carboxylate synthase